MRRDKNIKKRKEERKGGKEGGNDHTRLCLIMYELNLLGKKGRKKKNEKERKNKGECETRIKYNVETIN